MSRPHPARYLALRFPRFGRQCQRAFIEAPAAGFTAALILMSIVLTLTALVNFLSTGNGRLGLVTFSLATVLVFGYFVGYWASVTQGPLEDHLAHMPHLRQGELEAQVQKVLAEFSIDPMTAVLVSTHLASAVEARHKELWEETLSRVNLKGVKTS